MRFRILRPVNQTPAPQVLELSQLNLSRSSVLQYLDSILSAAVIGCQRCYLLSTLYPEEKRRKSASLSFIGHIHSALSRPRAQIAPLPFPLRLLPSSSVGQNKPHNVTETIHKSSLFGAVSCEILSIPGLCAPTRGATLRRTFSPSGPPARQPRDSGGPVNLAVRHSPSRPSYLLCILR